MKQRKLSLPVFLFENNISYMSLTQLCFLHHTKTTEAQNKEPTTKHWDGGLGRVTPAGQPCDIDMWSFSSKKIFVSPKYAYLSLLSSQAAQLKYFPLNMFKFFLNVLMPHYFRIFKKMEGNQNQTGDLLILGCTFLPQTKPEQKLSWMLGIKEVLHRKVLDLL